MLSLFHIFCEGTVNVLLINKGLYGSYRIWEGDAHNFSLTIFVKKAQSL